MNSSEQTEQPKEKKSPAHSPMPSRPNMKAPTPPKGAVPMEVKPLSQSAFGLISQKHRSRKWLWTVLIVVSMLLAFIAILIAKTGVYQIPYLSSLYRQRLVTRVVNTEAIPPQRLFNRVSDELRMVTSTQADDVRISFSEQEITGAFRGALQTSLKRPGVSVDQAQVVATQAGLEVTAFVHNETMSVHLFTRIVPIVSEGRVMFDVKEVYIGDLQVPRSALKQIERVVFGSEIGSFEAKAGKYRVAEISMKEGSVEFLFSTSTIGVK